jgi:hypothetical protein
MKTRSSGFFALRPEKRRGVAGVYQHVAFDTVDRSGFWAGKTIGLASYGSTISFWSSGETGTVMSVSDIIISIPVVRHHDVDHELFGDDVVHDENFTLGS